MYREDTFVTALRENDQSQNAQIPSSVRNVLNLYGQLTGVVAELSEKIAVVLNKQEHDFLQAYRAHMFNVQKELQQLRDKVKANELELKKNHKIRKLEEARDWFRSEALRLDKISQGMRKKLKYLQDKLDSIEEDRNWLEKQLKLSKKNNKLLRAELELKLGKGAKLPDGLTEEEGDYDHTHISSTLGDSGGDFSPISNKNAVGSPVYAVAHSISDRNGRMTAPPGHHYGVSKKFLGTPDCKYRMPEISPLPHNNTQIPPPPAPPSQLGMLFMECVNDVRSTIPPPSSVDSSTSSPTFEDSTNNNGINESQNIINKFLTNDLVIGMIYDELCGKYVNNNKSSTTKSASADIDSDDDNQLQQLVGKDVYEYLVAAKSRAQTAQGINSANRSLKLPPANSRGQL